MKHIWKGLLFIIVVANIGCNSTSDEVVVTGNISPTGSQEVYIEFQPLHYKYSPKERIAVNVSADGDLSVQFRPRKAFAWFVVGSEKIPLIVEKPSHLVLSQVGSGWDEIYVKGYANDGHKNFIAFKKNIKEIDSAIKSERKRFLSGRITETIDMYKMRVKVAKVHLANTPFHRYIYSTTGEYLVARLEGLELQLKHRRDVDADAERKNILHKAEKYNFFSFNSLKAQRAGIRDFMNAWANSFGIQDSVERALGKPMLIYDVKQLAFQEYDKHKRFVISRIIEPSARAYAQMHLVAEYLGEAPIDISEPAYFDFKERFSDYVDYVNVLTRLYEDIKRVSPGQPAVPFAFRNQEGELVADRDLRGTYVLLDFWAAWCVPCLDEFSHMQKLFAKYDRTDFEIVAINIDKEKVDWEKAIQRFENPWIQLYGGKEFENEVFKTYRGGGIPFYILLDRDGDILRYNDVRPSFNLESVLDEALAIEKSLVDQK